MINRIKERIDATRDQRLSPNKHYIAVDDVLQIIREEDEREVSQDEIKEAALYDKAYAEGARAGWNAALSKDERNDHFRESIANRLITAKDALSAITKGGGYCNEEPCGENHCHTLWRSVMRYFLFCLTVVSCNRCFAIRRRFTKCMVCETDIEER